VQPIKELSSEAGRCAGRLCALIRQLANEATAFVACGCAGIECKLRELCDELLGSVHASVQSSHSRWNHSVLVSAG